MNDSGGERMTEMESRHSTVLKLWRFHYSGHLVGVGGRASQFYAFKLSTYEMLMQWWPCDND